MKIGYRGLDGWFWMTERSRGRERDVSSLFATLELHILKRFTRREIVNVNGTLIRTQVSYVWSWPWLSSWMSTRYGCKSDFILYKLKGGKMWRGARRAGVESRMPGDDRENDCGGMATYREMKVWAAPRYLWLNKDIGTPLRYQAWSAPSPFNNILNVLFSETCIYF